MNDRTAKILSRGPYSIEVLGHSIRVVDKDGADVAVIGSVRDEFNRIVAEMMVESLNEG